MPKWRVLWARFQRRIRTRVLKHTFSVETVNEVTYVVIGVMSISSKEAVHAALKTHRRNRS